MFMGLDKKMLLSEKSVRQHEKSEKYPIYTLNLEFYALSRSRCVYMCVRTRLSPMS